MTVTGNYTGSMLIPHFGVNPENALTQEERNNQLQAIESGFVIEGEELVRSSAFYNLGFNLNYAFNLSKHIKLDFKAGVKNIFNSYQSDFDQGVYRDAGYIYGTSMPRTFYLTIKIGNG
jgi:outer membrane receptor for ferrienterochelin and colicins